MHVPIKEQTGDPIIDIALDTIQKGKQLIVFVNTKRGAEATAEKLSMKLKHILDKKIGDELAILAKTAESILSSPTKQCRRLAKSLNGGAAFHHSGLHSKQREIIEDNFKNRTIKVICATPTLAAGVDLPAYRVIIRDLKRFGGGFGMIGIPVLEYEQQSGRAGRPRYDTVGEAICIASSIEEKEDIWSHYITGLPEDILSKLAVEPVLRTYILSLVASGYVKSMSSLMEFMKKTLYAHQYGDITRLTMIIEKMVTLLGEWEFIEATKSGPDKHGFRTANQLSNEKVLLQATKLGHRVAELYLDPFTARFILDAIQRGANKSINEFSILQMISSTLEIRPRIRARKSDLELIDEKIGETFDSLVTLAVDMYSEEYDEFLDSMKTSIVLESWMDEINEEQLLERFNVTPGELSAKLDRADWLLYACYELSKLQNFRDVGRLVQKTRIRLSSGVKEELLALLKLKNIGRVRARKLFSNGVKDLGDVKKADIVTLSQILGKATAVDIKKQVGQEFDAEKIKVKPNKRKGQISLSDYSNQ